MQQGAMQLLNWQSQSVGCVCRFFPNRRAIDQRKLNRRSARCRAESENAGTQDDRDVESGSSVSGPSSSNSFRSWAAAGAVGVGVAAFLATRLSVGGVTLSTLEKNSMVLDTALQNHRPTLVEFYADWCEVCRELAPDVYKVEQEYKDKINFVMLNIENPKWAPEVAEYRVGGVPHFLFLNDDGEAQAAAVGRLPKQVLEGNVRALAEGSQMPFRGASGATSSINSPTQKLMMAGPSNATAPRSHS